jgi:hypothetical protein
MKRGIETQLTDYFGYVSEAQGSVDVLDVVYPVTPMSAAAVAKRPLSGWWIGVATAIAAAVLIGLVPLFLRSEGAVPPAENPQIATTTAPTATTSSFEGADTEATPTTVAPPTPLAEAVWGPSNGPLEFASVPFPPLIDSLDGGVWFNGRLYAHTFSGDLYSTTGGFDWVQEPMPNMSDGMTLQALATDGSRLIAVGHSEPDAIGSEPCSQPGDVIQVNVLDGQGAWTSSQIELPFSLPSSLAGCVTYWGANPAIGAAGILVGGSISGGLPFEAIIADQLGQEVAETMNGVEVNGSTLVVESGDGARSDAIDLAELGIADQMAEFAAYARNLIGSDEGDVTWFGERPIAWWSPDGQTWTLVDRSGPPMQDHQIQFVPTESGFLVTSDTDASGELIAGAVWSGEPTVPQDIRRWGDRLVVVGSNGVTLLSDRENVLLPSQAVSEYRLYFGGMGVVGVRMGGFGADLSADEPFLFSAEGTNWETWLPTEFEPVEGHMVRLVGIGNNFVVFHELDNQRLWIGRPLR